MRQTIATGFRQASCSTSRTGFLATTTTTPLRQSIASTSYSRLNAVERVPQRLRAPSAYFASSDVRCNVENWHNQQVSERANNASDDLPPIMAKPPRRRTSASTLSQTNKSHASKTPVYGRETVGSGIKNNNVQPKKMDNDRDHWLGRASTVQRPKTDASVRKAVQKSADNAEVRAPEAVDEVVSASKPPKKTIAERIRGLWANVKYLFRFYYNGVKQIWKDRQTVREMRAEVAQRTQDGKGGMRWLEKSIIELHDSDVRKLPLFLAILIILEEILPLVVIYAPSLLPSTCILPSQSLKMRAEEERKRGTAIKRLAGHDHVRAAVERLANDVCVANHTSQQEGDAGASDTTLRISQLEPSVVRDIASVFGLRAWGPISIVHSRIDKHLRYLREDDNLLRVVDRTGEDVQSSHDWSKIRQGDWLWRASGKRGLRVSEVDQLTMERNLHSYLQLVDKADADLSDQHEATALFRRALIPLALYDGTSHQLRRLETDADEEASKGIRKRTQEVVKSVVEEEKRKEEVKS